MSRVSTSLRRYGVGELAVAAGVSVQTIREWERRGFLEAERTAGGQRRFDDAAIGQARAVAAGRRRRDHATVTPGLPEGGADLARTGARIRAARLQAGLSQAEAAKRTGISRSFLSTIERGQSGVSVHVLADMADAFGIPMGEFAPAVAPTHVLHSDQRPRTVLAGGVAWEELVTPGRALEPALLHVPADADSGGHITRPGETFVFVLTGALVLQIDGTDGSLTVGEGDALLIEPATAYAWHNPTNATTRCLWVEHVPGARPSPHVDQVTVHL